MCEKCVVNVYIRVRDVAAGMVYLSESNIVHSDLAARNVLVSFSDNGKGSKYLAKIGDLVNKKEGFLELI